MKLPAASRSYLEINHALERVGKKPTLQDTPSERTAMLVSAIPALAASAECLLSEYQTSVYSNHHADVELARKAAAEVRNLSWREWVKRIISRIRIKGGKR